MSGMWTNSLFGCFSDIGTCKKIIVISVDLN